MSFSNALPHLSVMKEECLKGFSEKTIRIFCDATVGAGGHAAALLDAHPEIELYLACDRDCSALELAEKRLSKWKEKVRFCHLAMSQIGHCLTQQQIEKVDGFFLTLEFHLCS